MEIVELIRHMSTYFIEQQMKISQKTVWSNSLKVVPKKTPHEMVQNNLFYRIEDCDSLLKRNEIDPFLKCIVTSDEKWGT
uniref:Histonelysine Nmethyltransferase SETMARlike [Ceratitis capitata] n=1 Tax=Lepeophtheirus salmonis TaxID=72036 RepID=A0A0K2V278_LEPSM